MNAKMNLQIQMLNAKMIFFLGNEYKNDSFLEMNTKMINEIQGLNTKMSIVNSALNTKMNNEIQSLIAKMSHEIKH